VQISRFGMKAGPSLVFLKIYEFFRAYAQLQTKQTFGRISARYRSLLTQRRKDFWRS
jgi:hypothetical protein